MYESELAGKVAVVTGGSSGIGEACSRLLKAAGATIVIADIDNDTGFGLAEELGGAFFELDVRYQELVMSAAEQIAIDVGPVDVLVTSAGVIQRPQAPHKIPMSEWDNIFAVDTRGVFLCCVEFGTQMAQRGAGGSIINIASTSGLRSVPVHAYAPAKAGVVSITGCLAVQWGRSGVRVNAVAPGLTSTPPIPASIEAGTRNADALTQSSALGRVIHPDEVAEAVLFLASDRSSAITGVTLPVDAGSLIGAGWVALGGIPGPMHAVS